MAAVEWDAVAVDVDSPKRHDVRLDCSGQGQLYADKLLLAMLSPVFARVLFDQRGMYEGMKQWSSYDEIKQGGLIQGVTYEGPHTVLRMPNTGASVMRTILAYMYTDELAVNAGNVGELLHTAYEFDMRKVREKLSGFLEKVNTSDTFYSLLPVLEPYTELYDALLNSFMTAHSFSLINNQQFHLQPPEFVLKLVSLGSLSCTESELFLAVAEWSVHECGRRALPVNRTNQRACLDRILHAFHLPCLSNDHFSFDILPLGVLSDREVTGLFTYINHSQKDYCLPFPTGKRGVAGVGGKSSGYSFGDFGAKKTFAKPKFVPVVLSGPVCLVCTFANQVGAEVCDVCQTPIGDEYAEDPQEWNEEEEGDY